MPDLATFRRGLDYLGLSLGPASGRFVIQVPTAVYDGLFYEASKLMIAQSEAAGNGGILTEYAPPEGRSFGSGFWLQGHWIERG